MALKALMIRKKIDTKKSALEALRSLDAEYQRRAAEIETAIVEAQTEEEQQAVEESMAAYEQEQEEHEEKKSSLEGEIDQLESELNELERQALQKPPAGDSQKQRGEKHRVETRKKFFGMNEQERSAFLNHAEVKAFLERTRAALAGEQQRAVTGAELGIPTVVLDLIRENALNYSKLLNRVRLRSVSGKARQIIMGTIPEAVWTEACAALNELSFGYSEAEVDGYKVGGYVFICKATLEDSDLNLAAEIIEAIGQAIGIALDKAILFGTDNKMPLGIVTRLAQTAQPSDYPAKGRPWVDLSTSNIITIPGGTTGVALFQAIVRAGAAMKGKYSRGAKTWVMNEATYTALKVDMMTFNAQGAIVAAENGTMPVAGGDIVVLSDDIIADNTIVAGYFDLYLLAERAGAEFARSDDYRFIEDQVAFKGTARYDGLPVIPEGFVAIGLGAAPQTSATFPEDRANDSALTGLSVGTVTLTPAFDPNTPAYTATVTAVSDTVSAIPSQPGATVEITYDGKNGVNGEPVKWESGTKDLKITVRKGVTARTYTVAVNKAADK